MHHTHMHTHTHTHIHAGIIRLPWSVAQCNAHSGLAQQISYEAKVWKELSTLTTYRPSSNTQHEGRVEVWRVKDRGGVETGKGYKLNNCYKVADYILRILRN